MITPTQAYENKLYQQGYSNIAGLDEAGRGAWAGPIVAAAVIMPKDNIIEGVRDSKLLNPNKREEIFNKIKKIAISWSVGIVEIDFINKYNIGPANIKAFEIAIDSLDVKPDYALVDGIGFMRKTVDCSNNVRREYVKDGDAVIYSIAVSSIIAKVTRDNILKQLHNEYPEYGFDKHKGYGTKFHQEALEKNGICSIHRRLYKPIARIIAGR
ncbi:ribonuclease HII [Patescibacteria group bacterium]